VHCLSGCPRGTERKQTREHCDHPRIPIHSTCFLVSGRAR
jgi:hypothetical protein